MEVQELHALGLNTNTIFTWGNDATLLDKNANTWQGIFPGITSLRRQWIWICINIPPLKLL